MLLKPNIYQDTLGTNTGNAEKKRSFLVLSAGRSLASCMDGIKRGKKFADGTDHPDDAKQRWQFLSPRLWLLSHMSTQLWGSLTELYPGE